MPPAFTVSVLNWNGRAYLKACLESVMQQTYPAAHILLVDNGSTDDSVAFVREHFPQVAVHATGRNLGYAGGHNIALRNLTDDVILLLNPDVVLSPDCLTHLAEALGDDPSIGIAGCKLRYPDGRTIQHAGGLITRPRAVPEHIGVGMPDDDRFAASREVDFVTGAAMAIRRETVEQIGLLDEGIFLYFEDADYCTRAHKAGLRVVCSAKAKGIHDESATTVKGSFSYTQRFHTGRWYYLLKHFAAEELTGATLSAEGEWLGSPAPPASRALALAYLATLVNLPLIWSAREREGAGLPDDMTRQQIEAGLLALHRAAQQHGRSADALARLASHAELQDRPFTSDVPVLGPLIAWFRTQWNNIASRWYLRDLMDQQNEFNYLMLKQLEGYEAELTEQLQLLEEHVATQVELRERVRELEAWLTLLEREKPEGS